MSTIISLEKSSAMEIGNYCFHRGAGQYTITGKGFRSTFIVDIFSPPVFSVVHDCVYVPQVEHQGYHLVELVSPGWMRGNIFIWEVGGN